MPMSIFNSAYSVDPKYSELVLRLKRAVDSCHGAYAWQDVYLAIQRAKETKIREKTAALVSSFTFEELVAAEEFAAHAAFSKPPQLVAPNDRTQAPSKKTRRNR